MQLPTSGAQTKNCFIIGWDDRSSYNWLISRQPSPKTFDVILILNLNFCFKPKQEGQWSMVIKSVTTKKPPSESLKIFREIVVALKETCTFAFQLWEIFYGWFQNFLDFSCIGIGSGYSSVWRAGMSKGRAVGRAALQHASAASLKYIATGEDNPLGRENDGRELHYLLMFRCYPYICWMT